ncbi:MAG: molybdopterin-binding protein, partial [Holophagales bacterium]|nr:molybdopterin-binding protein [Holophagales bacterium]
MTVSDRASRGEYEDRGGPAIHAYLDEVLTSPWQPMPELVPDEQPLIEAVLRRLCDDGCSLVITTGGTGPAA